jgi:hypothetical protein
MLRQLLRRLRGADAGHQQRQRQHAAARPAPAVDALEERLLMAKGPPVITGVQFLGTSQNTTGFILTFNTALAPATANNPNIYELARKVTTGGSDGFLGIGGSDKETDIKHIGLASATYDDATHSVTLAAAQPLELARTFRRIRVQGEGVNALRTADGTQIDGNQDGRPGGDAVITFKGTSKSKVSYKDADGDKVKITLAGPGRLVAFVNKDKSNPMPFIFIRETDPARSVITGTVKKARRGDGVAVIPQILGTSLAQVQIKTDPAFQIVNEVA